MKEEEEEREIQGSGSAFCSFHSCEFCRVLFVLLFRGCETWTGDRDSFCHRLRFGFSLPFLIPFEIDLLTQPTQMIAVDDFRAMAGSTGSR